MAFNQQRARETCCLRQTSPNVSLESGQNMTNMGIKSVKREVESGQNRAFSRPSMFWV